MWKCSHCGYAENPDDLAQCVCGAITETTACLPRKKRQLLGLYLIAGFLFITGFASIVNTFIYQKHSYPMRLLDLFCGIAAVVTAVAIINLRPWAHRSFVAFSIIEISQLSYWQYGPEGIYSTSSNAFASIAIFVLVLLFLTSWYIRRKFRQLGCWPIKKRS